MIRVVADTNIYISALMFGGVPGSFLDLAFLKAFQLVSSAALLGELDEKLREKFKVSPDDASLLHTRLESIALMVKPEITLDVITDDPDDNRVLECAVAGNADYIVSGDRHLLRLGSYHSVLILTVRQFLDEFGRA